MSDPRAPTLDRDAAVRRVLWIVLGLNAAVAATKLTFALLSGAVSLFAEGIHSVLDASSNVVALVGLRVAAAPPDANHPYGHRRFEALAAFVIGLLIAAGMFEIGRQLVLALAGDREPPRVTPMLLASIAATIVANVVISVYERRRARALRSPLLEADAGHTMSDALGALAVLAGLGAVRMGFSAGDVVAAGIVMVLIARTAWRVLRENAGVLTDEAQLDPAAVLTVVLAVPGVRAAHKIRSRGAPGHVSVDLHIHLDPAMRLDAAHEKTHEVADAIRRAFPEVADVVIHTEPA